MNTPEEQDYTCCKDKWQAQGYAYRKYPLTEQEVRALIAAHVAHNNGMYACSWDILQLSDITPCADALAVQLDGEQGHGFSPQAEVKWKRSGDHYDVLLLTEQPIAALAQDALLASALQIRRLPDDIAVLVKCPGRPQSQGEQSSDGKQCRLDMVEYYHPTTASLLFVRYTWYTEEGKEEDHHDV